MLRVLPGGGPWWWVGVPAGWDPWWWSLEAPLSDCGQVCTPAGRHEGQGSTGIERQSLSFQQLRCLLNILMPEHNASNCTFRTSRRISRLLKDPSFTNSSLRHPMAPRLPTTTGTTFTLQPGHCVAKSAASSLYLLHFSLCLSRTKGSQPHVTSKMMMSLLWCRKVTRTGRRSVSWRSVGILRSISSLASELPTTATPSQPAVPHFRPSGCVMQCTV